MRIKKISPTTPANGNIENQYGTSQTNAYSEEYSNTTFATKDVATTSADGLMSASDKDKLDKLTDTGWIDDAGGVFSYRLLNKVVYIKFNDKQITLTANTWLALGTLPSGQGLRPSQYTVLDGANNGVDGKYTSAITTTGSVRVRNTTGGTDVINGMISYIP